MFPHPKGLRQQQRLKHEQVSYGGAEEQRRPEHKGCRVCAWARVVIAQA